MLARRSTLLTLACLLSSSRIGTSIGPADFPINQKCENSSMATSVLKKIIYSPLAPKPVGPYNQAVQHDNTLYISGVLGIDASSGKMAEGVENQAKQALTNMGHILKEAGGSYEHVVKTTILLNDINDFATVNNVYGQFFKPPYPARSTFQVGKLPLGAAVEIEAIAGLH
ncbi:hypothetical protein M8J77_016547 [Diaphorina citri]|nr:hypothetical protein M8J77_016547 [Diaphorina citri]